MKRLLLLILPFVLIVSCSGPAHMEPLSVIQPSDGSPSAADLPAPTDFAEPATIAPKTAAMLDTSVFNIILGRPTDHSVTASILAQKDMQISIRYRPETSDSPCQIGPVSLRAGQPQNIELANLAADTEYMYQIVAAGVSSVEHRFHTQRAAGRAFTFTIDADPHYGDPRFNGSLYAILMNNAVKDHPDFHINLGDTFMTEKLKVLGYAEAETTFTAMRPYFGLLGVDAPLFLVNGNHEGELGWLLKGKDHELPVWCTQLRQLYYPNPIPGSFYSGASVSDASLGSPRDTYYSWTWGDALFVVLDPFWYTTQKPQAGNLDNNWGWTLGREQYDWLKTTLETSPAIYKFIFIHHLVGGNDKDARGGIEAAPYFEWGGKNSDGSYGFNLHRPGWGKPIHQLLFENHVSAVFHGHDHVFVKQVLDGIIYQEVPQPSITQYDNIRLAADYGYLSGEVLSSSGYLRVTVAQTAVTVEYVRVYLPQDERPGRQTGMVFSYMDIHGRR